MDTGTGLPPSLSASGSGLSLDAGGSQQRAPQLNAQQPAPQRTAQQQAVYDDFLRRCQSEAQTLGIPFDPAQMGQAMAAGPTAADQNAMDAFQAGFRAFMQNCPPSQGNMWGSNPSTPSRGGARGQGTFERVSGELPVDKFPYGTAEADWEQWLGRFERAVKVATNATTQSRLEELYLMWIPLKLNDDAQPIYGKCVHKDGPWPLLRVELGTALENPMVRRKWQRYPDAYKKPSGMSLEVYKANIVAKVNKYSPALASDPVAYGMELYNRFVNGLEVDYRDYIEDSIPYSKETIDNAYSQALKHEAKLTKKSVDFSGGAAAAMTDAEKDGMEKIRLDLEKMKTQMAADKAAREKRESQGSRGRNWGNQSQRDDSQWSRGRSWGNRNQRSESQRGGSREDRRDSREGRRGGSPYPNRGRESRQSSSGRSASSRERSRSGSGSFRRNDFRAIQTADEDSDSEFSSTLVKNATAAFSQALSASMKGLSLRSKGSKKGSRQKKD